MPGSFPNNMPGPYQDPMWNLQVHHMIDEGWLRNEQEDRECSKSLEQIFVVLLLIVTSPISIPIFALVWIIRRYQAHKSYKDRWLKRKISRYGAYSWREYK